MSTIPLPSFESRDWDSRSSWDAVTADERDIWRGLVVQEFGPEGVDLLDYLAHQSTADPTEIHA